MKSYKAESQKSSNMLKPYVYLYSNGLWLFFFTSTFYVDLFLDSNRDAKIEDVEKIANVSKKKYISIRNIQNKIFPMHSITGNNV